MEHHNHTTSTPPEALIRDEKLTFMSLPASPDKITAEMQALANSIRNCDQRNVRLEIEAAYCVAHDELEQHSPFAIPVEPYRQGEAVLALFEPDDRLFNVEKPEVDLKGVWTDRTALVGEKLLTAVAVSPWVLPNRAVACGAERRLLVITANSIDEDPSSGAVFRWLSVHLGMELLAVTWDYNGLHGFFKPVVPMIEEMLSEYLPFYGLADSSSFEREQLFLLPGAERRAELVYLSKAGRGYLPATEFDN